MVRETLNSNTEIKRHVRQMTPASLPGTLFKSGIPASVTGLAGTDAVFTWLERHQQNHAQERENWWRTTSAAMAMLKHANTQLAKIEKRIDELENLATKDDLTGLYNRRGFLEAFGRELDRAKRGHSTGGLVILIDLDNFKMINDTYGHAAGDAALKVFAKALMHEIRDMDVAGRLGGDEFALLFANADKAKTSARAQALAARLNNLSLIWHGAEIPVRASLGMKVYKAGDTAKRIFADADASMYDAKRKNKGELIHSNSF